LRKIPKKIILIAIQTLKESGRPRAEVIYPEPVRARTGTPIIVETKKNQPIKEPVRSLKARVTKNETPPSFGYCADNNPMVRAIGNASRITKPHDIREAGPAISAARPGRMRIPQPKTAPT